MLDNLHHFVLVCERGSFTEAAEVAHITQPGLSASIKRLEEALDATLLHRLPRGAVPTAAGEALLPRARAALAAVEEGRRAVREVQGLGAGEVRIGGGAVAATWMLPPVLADFRASWPGVTLRLRELFTPEVPTAVDDGRLDLGIAEAPQPHDRSDRLRPDPLVFAATPEVAARWWDGAHLDDEAPRVTFPAGASLRRALDAALPPRDPVIELGSISAVKGMLRAGVGVGLISHAAVAVDLELGRLVALPDPRTPPPRDLVLRHRGRARLSPSAATLRQVLLERLGTPARTATDDASVP